MITRYLMVPGKFLSAMTAFRIIYLAFRFVDAFFSTNFSR